MSSSGYIIVNTHPSPSETTDAANTVIYDSVEMTQFASGNENDVFRVYNNLPVTERLYMMNRRDPNIHHIVLMRKPAVELATLPPPRNNILYLVSDYEKIHDPFVSAFVKGEVSVSTKSGTRFGDIKKTLKGFTKRIHTMLISDKDALMSDSSPIQVYDASGEDISGDSLPSSLRNISSKTPEGLYKDIYKDINRGWKMILNMNPERLATEKILNPESTRLMLNTLEAPQAETPAAETPQTETPATPAAPSAPQAETPTTL